MKSSPNRNKSGKFVKGNDLAFKKGHVPHNKLIDEFSELKISRQKKYLMRKRKYDVSQNS